MEAAFSPGNTGEDGFPVRREGRIRCLTQTDATQSIHDLGGEQVVIVEVRERREELHLVLESCSPAFVSHLNLLPALVETTAEIESVVAPYYCEQCEQEKNEIVASSEIVEGAPERFCDSCGASLQIEEPPEEYFAFWQHGASR